MRERLRQLDYSLIKDTYDVFLVFTSEHLLLHYIVS
jgi:hypothetical protein